MENQIVEEQTGTGIEKETGIEKGESEMKIKKEQGREITKGKKEEKRIQSKKARMQRSQKKGRGAEKGGKKVEIKNVIGTDAETVMQRRVKMRTVAVTEERDAVNEREVKRDTGNGKEAKRDMVETDMGNWKEVKRDMVNETEVKTEGKRRAGRTETGNEGKTKNLTREENQTDVKEGGIPVRREGKRKNKKTRIEEKKEQRIEIKIGTENMTRTGNDAKIGTGIDWIKIIKILIKMRGGEVIDVTRTQREDPDMR